MTQRRKLLIANEWVDAADTIILAVPPWIAADLIYIPLYLYKSLWLTSILYGVFLILCIVGLRSWMGALRAETLVGEKPLLAADERR